MLIVRIHTTRETCCCRQKSQPMVQQWGICTILIAMAFTPWLCREYKHITLRLLTSLHPQPHQPGCICPSLMITNNNICTKLNSLRARIFATQRAERRVLLVASTRARNSSRTLLQTKDPKNKRMKLISQNSDEPLAALLVYNLLSLAPPPLFRPCVCVLINFASSRSPHCLRCADAIRTTIRLLYLSYSSNWWCKTQ